MVDRSRPTSAIRCALPEFLLAFTFLTRAPTPQFELPEGSSLGTAVWAFPLVGALVGLTGGAAFLALEALLGFPASQLSMVLALVAMVLMTGALHADGWADFWDGIGGGRTRARKLEIMRDSHTGTYGVLALVAALAITAGAMQLTYERLFSTIALNNALSGPDADHISRSFFAAVCFIGVIMLIASAARVALVLLAAWLPPTRADGLARLMDGMTRARVVWAAAAWCAIAAMFIALSYALNERLGLGAEGLGRGVAVVGAIALGSGLGTIIVGRLAHRHLGGITGDVLGACVMMATVMAWLAVAIALVWVSPGLNAVM